MRIIAKKTLVKFYLANTSSKGSLEAWFAEAELSEWGKPGDIINDYPTADVITGKRFVFNIKGNHYRLIVDVEFKFKTIYIVWIGTHADYNKVDVKMINYVKNH